MNKILYIVLVMAVCISFAEAQSITKPVKGDRLFELSASGINELGADLNTTRGGLMIRNFISDKKVRRLAANLNLQFEIAEGGKKRFNEISLAYGIENHMKGSSRMSTYWGYAGGLNMESTDDIAVAGGAFTGFDYYLADGLYIGTEVGYNALISIREGGESDFGLSLPGAAMNGAFRMGYRF